MSRWTDVIFNKVKSGMYDKSPKAIGDLTLKIGTIVDNNPTEEVVLEALDILTSIEYSETEIFGVEDAILHKIEYLINQYRYLIPDDIWVSNMRFILESRQDFVSVLKNADPNLELLVLQRVIEEDVYGNREGHYEIAKMQVRDILLANGEIPARENIKRRSENAYAPPPPPNNPNGNPGGGNGGNNSGGGNGGNPPPPPSQDWNRQYQSGSVPPPDDPHVDGWSTRVDVLRLVLMALLRSVITKATRVQNGVVQISIKPDVLNRVFEEYEFDYSFSKYNEQKTYSNINKNSEYKQFPLWPEQKTKFIKSSGIEYVCQILEKYGYAPQIGNNDTIIVRDTNKAKAYEMFTINDYSSLYLIGKQITPLQNEALMAIQMEGYAKKEASRGLFNVDYTAFNALKYWDIIGQYPEYAATMNMGR
ncbi:MAG: hypothetical protein IKZ49_02390 [Alphaproteobacteria bacterium]|nr:hypothetical protein [Alphaproteobacteria bacterium]